MAQGTLASRIKWSPPLAHVNYRLNMGMFQEILVLLLDVISCLSRVEGLLTSRYRTYPRTPVALEHMLHPFTATLKLFIGDATLCSKADIGLKVGEHMLAVAM